MSVPATAGRTRRTLIPAHERIGLSRAEAAEYVGVSTPLFEELVAEGRMPPPKLLNSRKVWHRERLAEAFAELPEEGQDQKSGSPWMDCAWEGCP
jgi:excisionase family DNA binding protein